MKICDDNAPAKGWTLDDFKPGDVVEVEDSGLGIVAYSPSGTALITVLVLKQGMVWNLELSTITARYPDACLKKGKREERP